MHLQWSSSRRGPRFVLFVVSCCLLAVSVPLVPFGAHCEEANETTSKSPGVNQATTTLAPIDELDSTLATEEPVKGTTVKKELQPTEPSTTTTTARINQIDSTQTTTTTTTTGQQQQQQQQTGNVGRIGELVGSLGSLGGQVNQVMGSAVSQAAKTEPSGEDDSLPDTLVPSRTSLFDKDAINLQELGSMDCHLRNVDYCVAGIMGSASKLLPETNDEFEVRCDEMKATSTCLAAYNKRCSTFKVFAALGGPFAGGNSQLVTGPNGDSARAAKLPEQAESLLMNTNRTGRVSMADLMGACEPDEKRKETNKLIRSRLFTLASCINSRVPKLRPCLEDLKTALQLFYEPSRSLPLRPTCCALGRFRQCSQQAMDRVCGLSSFDQLLEQLTSGAGSSGPISMVRSIELVCRQSASDFRSAYCAEVLPAGGMRGPQRRGRKASKLAKALDLISFAPAAQDNSFAS